jgi:malonyl-CoA/methylmalonyl-CoA synthetase
MTVLGDLRGGGDRLALQFGDTRIPYSELAALASDLGGRLADVERAAVWAEPRAETAVAVVAALHAGRVVVPINPKLGELEFRHEISDSAPDAVLAPADAQLPDALGHLPRLDIPLTAKGVEGATPAEVDDTAPALILYTSGTTGMPKGVVLSRGAIASNLDALATAWAWTGDDVVVQALPLFHAHGLILGVLGTLRRNGTVRHLGRFDPASVADAFRDGGTMLFAVPTMYHRLADACKQDPALAAALGNARLLVSGSAALPAREHRRIEDLTGQRVVERYGLSETIMVCSVRHDGDRRAGYVGLPLDGVEVRLVDESGATIEASDDETLGEVAVRGPNLFGGYLNRPAATAEVMKDGWFMTGDMATRADDGYIRIVGRRSTDLIKTGGYRVGAGEVEAALLEHPDLADAAVLGLPDDDLGERIVAWVVPRAGATVEEDEIIEHVRRLLSVHKRPREVRVVDQLPHNALGKVQKTLLL